MSKWIYTLTCDWGQCVWRHSSCFLAWTLYHSQDSTSVFPSWPSLTAPGCHTVWSPCHCKWSLEEEEWSSWTQLWCYWRMEPMIWQCQLHPYSDWVLLELLHGWCLELLVPLVVGQDNMFLEVQLLVSILEHTFLATFYLELQLWFQSLKDYHWGSLHPPC